MPLCILDQLTDCWTSFFVVLDIFCSILWPSELLFVIIWVWWSHCRLHDWKLIHSNRVPAVWTSQATNGNNEEAGKEMYFTSKEIKESFSRDRMTWITINATNNGKYLCWLSLDLGGNISVVNICSFRKSQSTLSTSHVLSINCRQSKVRKQQSRCFCFVFYL